MNYVRQRRLKMNAIFYFNVKLIMILESVGSSCRKKSVNFFRLDVTDQLSVLRSFSIVAGTLRGS